jgi:hypothetical protein
MSRPECARVSGSASNQHTGTIGRWKPDLRHAHHAIGAGMHGLDFERFGQHTIEGGVIIVVIDQTHSADATIQHMREPST